MAKFVDKLGREWNLDINVAAMRRAKRQDIDLSMPVAQMQQFVMDDVFLVDALWAIVQPHASGLTLEQFEEGFDGEAIDRGRDALWLSLEEYFALGKAEMLRAAVDNVRAEMENAIRELSTSNGLQHPRENLASTSENSA